MLFQKEVAVTVATNRRSWPSSILSTSPDGREEGPPLLAKPPSAGYSVCLAWGSDEALMAELKAEPTGDGKWVVREN
jgi:hypothetical protein